jgi:hypothetical protein
MFSEYLNMNVVGVEYPGYGIYKDHLPNARQIEKDA